MPIIAPFPLAVVICDGIWVDPYTGKRTLIGTFSAVGGDSFPLIHPILFVYFALTDGVGKMPVRLELVDAEGRYDEIFSHSEEIEFSDPRAIIEGHFVAGNLLFPRAGEYRVKLFANDDFLIERRLLVVGRKGPPDDHEE